MVTTSRSDPLADDVELRGRTHDVHGVGHTPSVILVEALGRLLANVSRTTMELLGARLDAALPVFTPRNVITAGS